MNMDKNDSFDGPLQEGRHTTLRSFSWGNREFTISSDKISTERLHKHEAGRG